MNAPPPSQDRPGGGPAGDLSALFANLVMQQANLAMMLLGRTTHPDIGQVTQDLEAARLFIDQLEMLETKTRGNLTKAEEALLKQSLLRLRLAFVEAVETPSAPAAPPGPTAAPAPAASPGATPAPQDAAPPPAGPAEHRVKFSKKY